MEDINQKCPCFSGKFYQECCKPFHDGKSPDNALQLMRARFSAYAMDIPEYIVDTTHPASPQYLENKLAWKRNISKFSRSATFKKLEILNFQEKNDLATVTFTAHLSRGEEDNSFTEKSYFQKIKGHWLYLGGQLSEGHAPNLVTTGQFRLLPLAYYVEAVLRKKADPIVEITDDIKTLAAEMIETMDAADGIGLAAPQIHHSIRLFIIRKPSETDDDKIENGEIKVYINPKLSEPSKETWMASEGCLSIPALRGEVERPNEITVEYTNLEGKLVKEKIKGWEARVVMHENDHINGVLFIDRLEKNERAKLEPLLEKLKKRIHDGRNL